LFIFRPEERKKGFTAVIDRRSEKWIGVKLVLDRLKVRGTVVSVADAKIYTLHL
jgi:hypothetical protein